MFYGGRWVVNTSPGVSACGRFLDLSAHGRRSPWEGKGEGGYGRFGVARDHDSPPEPPLETFGAWACIGWGGAAGLYGFRGKKVAAMEMKVGSSLGPLAVGERDGLHLRPYGVGEWVGVAGGEKKQCFAWLAQTTKGPIASDNPERIDAWIASGGIHWPFVKCRLYPPFPAADRGTMQHLDSFHFILPISCNSSILWQHLLSDGICSTDKADRSRQLGAMSWSWETSTSTSSPALTCSRGLRRAPQRDTLRLATRIDSWRVQQRKGFRTRKTVLRFPCPIGCEN